ETNSNVTAVKSGTKSKSAEDSLSSAGSSSGTVAVRSSTKSKKTTAAASDELEEVGYGPGDTQEIAAKAVRFLKNGGTGDQMAQQPFDYGETVTLYPSTYSREGYIFTGWNDMSDGSGMLYYDQQSVKSTSLSVNYINLYAVWSPVEFTVSFSANGGTGTMLDQTFKYGVAGTLSSNQFKYTGRTFLSWNTKADGTGTSYADNATTTISSTGDGVTLYAQWSDTVSYTVRHWQQNLTGNAGTHDSTNYTCAETETLTDKYDNSVTPAVKTYEGFTAPSTQTITLTADTSANVVDYYYTRNSYTITYTNPEGLSGDSVSNHTAITGVLYGQSVTLDVHTFKKDKDTEYTNKLVLKANGSTSYPAYVNGVSTYTVKVKGTTVYTAYGWVSPVTTASTTTSATTAAIQSSLVRLLGMTELEEVGDSVANGGTLVCKGNTTLVPSFTTDVTESPEDGEYTLPGATRNGYDFVGWSESSSDSSADYSKGEEYTISSEDDVLYGVWSKSSSSSSSSTSTSNRYASSSTSRVATTSNASRSTAQATPAVADGNATVVAKKSTTKTKATGEAVKDDVPPTGEDDSSVQQDEVREAARDLIKLTGLFD
nr:InlB B-repeat-containing protein [Lachnospiraceae bacterium]